MITPSTKSLKHHFFLPTIAGIKTVSLICLLSLFHLCLTLFLVDFLFTLKLICTSIQWVTSSLCNIMKVWLKLSSYYWKSQAFYKQRGEKWPILTVKSTSFVNSRFLGIQGYLGLFQQFFSHINCLPYFAVYNTHSCIKCRQFLELKFWKKKNISDEFRIFGN